eukprot:scaffold55546_cov69-Phaeocystis_antarctica.AAC.4
MGSYIPRTSHVSLARLPCTNSSRTPSLTSPSPNLAGYLPPLLGRCIPWPSAEPPKSPEQPSSLGAAA